MRFNQLALLLTIASTAACTDPEAPTAESTQDLTVVEGNCVAAGQYNAEMFVDNVKDTREDYARTPPDTCAAKTTLVYVNIDPPLGGSSNFIEGIVEDGTWGIDESLTLGQRKTMCENSTLALRVLDAVSGAQLSYAETHPVWFAASGSSGAHCGQASLFYAPSGTSTYIARVLAIRGLEQNNHGYAHVHVEAGHQTVIH
jgi:hypothetical protein